MHPRPPPTPGPPLAAIEAVRMRMARHQRHGADLRALVAEVAAESSRAIGVTRVGVWLLDTEGRRLSILHLHDQTGPQAYEGTSMMAEDLPRYFEALSEGRVLRIDDVVTDGRAAEIYEGYLKPLGIGALLDVPILRDGRAVGVLCHEHHGPARRWTDAEASLGMAAADTIAVGLANAERDAAQSELSRLRGHEDDARHLHLLGKMAAGIAHDLNNILTIVAGNAELLGELGEHSPEAQDVIGEIRRTASRGKDLARELMELDRSRKSAPRVLDVSAHLRDFARALERGLGRSYRVRLQGDSAGQVLIDPRQLERVVMNLVVNARDSMPDGGTITLSAMDVSLPGTGDEPPDSAVSWVRVDVVDAGFGMEAATAQRLFEPYFSTKTNGKGGLGMTIVKDLVARAGGFLDVTSEVGLGTCISVYLPRVA